MKINLDKIIHFTKQDKIFHQGIFSLIIFMLTVAIVSFIIKRRRRSKASQMPIQLNNQPKEVQTCEEMMKQLENNGFIRLKSYRPSQEEDLFKYDDELYSVKQFKSKYPHAKGFICYSDSSQKVPYNYIGICDAELIHEFMVEKEKYYERDVTLSYVARILGDSLLFNLSDVWRMKRKIYGQMFHFYQYHQLVKLVREISTRTSYIIDMNLQQPVQLISYFEDILGEWALHLFFGHNASQYDLQSKLKAAYNNARSAILLLQPQHIIHCLDPLKEVLLEYLYITSDEIKRDPDYQSKPQNNITWYLLNSKEVQWNKEFLDQICQDIIIFFFAGRDTMAHTLQMLFYYLSIYPQYKKKIDEEIESLNGDYSVQNISNLNYLEAVFKETLRHYGPTTTVLPKVVMERHSFMNNKVFLEEGTIVSLAIQELNYDPQHYENPFKFYPERWFDENLKQKEKKIFMPFSYGSHKCIGDKLALPVMKMLYITLNEYFSINIDPSFKLKLVALIQYTPSTQIPFLITKKKNIQSNSEVYFS
ncbi:hypothetical protein ABPG72_014072 [Tetrahymena utriculariae]